MTKVLLRVSIPWVYYRLRVTAVKFVAFNLPNKKSLCWDKNIMLQSGYKRVKGLLYVQGMMPPIYGQMKQKSAVRVIWEDDTPNR